MLARMSRKAIVTWAAYFGILISAASGQGKHSAVTPGDRGNDWWKQRAKLLNERVQETQDTRLVFIGDSITQGWEGAGKDVWAERYAPYKAVNLGIGGDRTQHVLYRLQNGNLDGIAPEAAVVMIGTNNSNGIDNTARQIAEGVAAIVEELRSKTPQTKILLLGIFPRGENINEQRGKLLQINQILAKHDDGEHVFFLDIGHHFINEQGLIPGEIMPDYLHLSPAGYELWAEAIDPYLTKWLGEPVAEKSPLLGEWVYVMPGPQGEDLEMDLKIEEKEGKITGSLGMNDRQFAFEKAKIDGDTISFAVTRDRPGGGDMVYTIKGTLKDGKLGGTVAAEMDGEEVESNWTASRSE